MGAFREPTKTELENAVISICSTISRELKRANDFALQMDRFTDPELIAKGFTAEQVAYLRSAIIGLKNTVLKYQNNAPLNNDNPQYFIEYMLDIRNF